MRPTTVRFAVHHPLRWVVPCCLIGVVTVGLITARTPGASLVPTRQPAPDLTLPTLEGKTVKLTEHRDRVVLLLFGELYNANSVAAAKDLTAVLNRPAMAEVKASVFMVVTQKASAAELKAAAADKGVTIPILHDEGRRTFAAYRVMVLPSLVVIDPRGTTLLACAGYPLDFQDMVADVIHLAGGRISSKEFERRRTVATNPAVPVASVRAARLALLAEQLARRGSEELAITNFVNALELDPDCLTARIGLGNCRLDRGELAEAEKHFLHLLGLDPDSTDAALGLIHVQVVRGGDELEAARRRMQALLGRHPQEPKVVYLAGRVAEESKDPDAALGHYKRAAELLLFGQSRRWNPK